MNDVIVKIFWSAINVSFCGKDARPPMIGLVKNRRRTGEG
jgi:hypothetical protein